PPDIAHMPVHDHASDNRVRSRTGVHRGLRHHVAFGSRVFYNVMLRIGRKRQAGARQQTKSDPCDSLLHVTLVRSSIPQSSTVIFTGSCEGTPGCPARLLRKRKTLLQHILQSWGPSPRASASPSSSAAVPRQNPRPASSPPLSSREMSPTTAAPAQALAPRSTCGRSHRRTPTQAPESALASVRQTR